MTCHTISRHMTKHKLEGRGVSWRVTRHHKIGASPLNLSKSAKSENGKESGPWEASMCIVNFWREVTFAHLCSGTVALLCSELWLVQSFCTVVQGRGRANILPSNKDHLGQVAVLFEFWANSRWPYIGYMPFCYAVIAFDTQNMYISKVLDRYIIY